jgi:hypothetical protein
MGSPGTNLLHTSQAFFDKYLKGWVALTHSMGGIILLCFNTAIRNLFPNVLAIIVHPATLSPQERLKGLIFLLLHVDVFKECSE